MLTSGLKYQLSYFYIVQFDLQVYFRKCGFKTHLMIDAMADQNQGISKECFFSYQSIDLLVILWTFQEQSAKIIFLSLLRYVSHFNILIIYLNKMLFFFSYRGNVKYCSRFSTFRSHWLPNGDGKKPTTCYLSEYQHLIRCKLHSKMFVLVIFKGICF